MIINLKGVAAETVKNIVLAGIGTLILVDSEDVSEEDLGAGFLFREGDVGKKVNGPFVPLEEHADGFSLTALSLFSVWMRPDRTWRR